MATALLPLTLNYDGVLPRAGPGVALMTAMVACNVYGAYGTALWLTLQTGSDGRTWGEERNATADHHRVDPVLVDQARRGRLGGESRAADRDVALPRLGLQPLDPSARPPEARRALPSTADSVVEDTTLESAFQSAANSSIASSSDGSWSAVS